LVWFGWKRLGLVKKGAELHLIGWKWLVYLKLGAELHLIGRRRLVDSLFGGKITFFSFFILPLVYLYDILGKRSDQAYAYEASFANAKL
jgi:hypothetical protein